MIRQELMATYVDQPLDTKSWITATTSIVWDKGLHQGGRNPHHSDYDGDRPPSPVSKATLDRDRESWKVGPVARLVSDFERAHPELYFGTGRVDFGATLGLVCLT